ncbi:MAG: hypothetical protein IKQ97_03720, partial [Eubacterium sp.]|nr:hypothetical protein [Eubacterium sp.]
AIYADHIYAQSDEMRETFIKLLNEFVTKEEGQSVIDFETRIIAFGSACDDWASRKDGTKPIPDEWIGRVKSENGELKKIIVFYISGSMLFEHGASEVDRASATLEKLKMYEGAVVVWHIDKYARQILKKHNPSAWNAFRKLRDEYVSDEKVILDETWDMERAAKLADVYVGDASIAMNMCRIDHKPVLWLTPGVWEESADVVNGCPKAWTGDILIATEGTDEGRWSVEEFMNTALRYHKETVKTEHGREIWRSIHES